MAHCVVKIRDKYLVWSSIMSSPVTWGGTLEDLRAYWRMDAEKRAKEEVQRTMDWLEKEAIPLAEETGTSWPALTPQGLLDLFNANNRYGKSVLTMDDMYRYYCVERREP